MSGLTGEDALIAAEEVCAATGARVRDLSALVAAAAVPGARIGGIPVHRDRAEARAALAEAVARLQPLTGANDALARVLDRIAFG